jgi:hypothetical protein
MLLVFMSNFGYEIRNVEPLKVTVQWKIVSSDTGGLWREGTMCEYLVADKSERMQVQRSEGDDYRPHIDALPDGQYILRMVRTWDNSEAAPEIKFERVNGKTKGAV